ncbi:MAG TPA: hypothetical protein VG028_10770 [Terriglobia bacterium]|nr:hypothetical protein [Terriglobia bacterium]
MKRLPWLLLAAAAANTPLLSDTVYQTNAQGKQVVIQRQAIVVQEDSNYVYYKHFDLKDRRVEKVGLNQGSLPYMVNRSAAADRQQIVSIWKRFGYKVTVTDLAGKTTEVFDAYLDFYPPAGRGSLLESVPARTNFPISMGSGNADEVEFSKIARIDFQGPQMKITLRTGEVETGTFLMPTDHPAEARLLGITDHYDPASADVFDFSQPIARLKEIRFDSE